MNLFKLTFTNPVASVAVYAGPNMDRGNDPITTLTAYDASNTAVDTDTAVSLYPNTLTATSATNNIKYFTIATDDFGAQLGIAFTNIVWGCAA